MRIMPLVVMIAVVFKRSYVPEIVAGGGIRSGLCGSAQLLTVVAVILFQWQNFGGGSSSSSRGVGGGRGSRP